MVLHAGLVDLSSFGAWAQTRRGGRGLINLRRVAEHGEPKSESPMETRLRMYDGAVHRDSLAEDNRRQNRFLGEGIRLLRFTAGDLSQPALVVAQVRTVLDGRA